ncbi:MAG TPA: DUF4091 domain-containing protein, partial [Armatimonadetes bacterium]|nr:DUF4091 domain-containing protein [Armatimonadota bacterium]
QPAAEAPKQPTHLRGWLRILLYAPQAGAQLRVTLRAVQIGRYENEVQAGVEGLPEAQVTAYPPGVGKPREAELTFTAPHAGPLTLWLNTGQNAAVVEAHAPHTWWTMTASRREPLHVIGRAGRLYFYVPPGTERFAVLARGAGTEENVRLQVYTPEGKLAGEASARGGAEVEVPVSVRPGQQGRVWYFTADRPPDLPGVFEDAYLWLSDDVPPYVSVRPESLLVPFCQGLVQRPRFRGTEPLSISLHLNAEPAAGETFWAALFPAEGERPLLSGERPAAERKLTLRLPPDLAEGEYRLRAELRAKDGRPRARDEGPVQVTARLLFVGGYQPLVRAELQPAKEPLVPPLVVRRNVAEPAPTLRVQVRLLRTAIPDPPGGSTAEVVAEKSLSRLGEEPQTIVPPAELTDGHYQWQVIATAENGEWLDWTWRHFLRRKGNLFTEVPPPPAPPLPVLTAEERARGFVGFVPEAVDAIPYNYRPQPADRERPLSLFAARGEIEPATFGLWACKSVRGVTITVSPLRHRNGTVGLPAEAVEVRLARHWPQRVSWNTSTYRIIPEMLEQVETFDLAPGQLRQVWLTVHLPGEARPGHYRGTVRVRAANGATWEKPLEVEVLPFALRRPREVHWGLYSDSGRWNRYPDEQVRAELADIVAHGITTLMLYPLSHSEVTYENGRLGIDSTRFARYVDWAKESGLGPPWVMSMQALAWTVRRLLPGRELTDPEFKRLYQDITRHFVRLAQEHGWGECVWHAVDEPWSTEAQHRAATELGYFKELGLTTFTTAGPTGPELDAVLDVRCYSSGHFLSSPEVTQKRWEEARASGDRVWFYGSGCYTGQDGNLISNRYLTGFMFWKSGAAGEWSWTFIRPKADPYDDFDGEEHREAKDACIAYPSTEQGAPTPTLQWEGIREGIDDYCYLYTMQQVAEEVGGAAGQRAREALEQILAQVPWGTRPGDFTAADAQRLRRAVAAQIRRLYRG